MDYTDFILGALLGGFLTHLWWRIRIHLTAARMIEAIRELRDPNNRVITATTDRMLIAEDHAGQLLFHDAETNQFVLQAISLEEAAQTYATLSPDNTAVLVRYDDELVVFNEGSVLDKNTTQFTFEK